MKFGLQLDCINTYEILLLLGFNHNFVSNFVVFPVESKKVFILIRLIIKFSAHLAVLSVKTSPRPESAILSLVRSRPRGRHRQLSSSRPSALRMLMVAVKSSALTVSVSSTYTQMYHRPSLL